MTLLNKMQMNVDILVAESEMALARAKYVQAQFPYWRRVLAGQ